MLFATSSFMTKLQLIKAIGDLLTQLDVQIGSLELDDPHRSVLKLKRNDLDARQRELAGAVIKQSAENLKPSLAELERQSKALKVTIKNLENLEQTLEDVTKFIGVLDQVITVAAGLSK